MTQIVGTLTSSTGELISGTLEVQLQQINQTDVTTPDTIYTTRVDTFTITNGAISIDVPESETLQIPYSFKFTEDGETAPLFELFKIVPNVGTVELSSFFPTGISDTNLDTSLLRIARLMGRNDSLSRLIKQPAIFSIVIEGETATVKQFFPKPFAGDVLVENLSILGISDYENWTFDIGIVNSSGTEDLLTPSNTISSTGNGRAIIQQVYEASRASTIMGFFIEATPQAGSSALTATLSLSFIEV